MVFLIALIITSLATGRVIGQRDTDSLAWLSAISFLSGRIIKGFGAALWFWAGKPTTFYSQNPASQLYFGFFFANVSCISYAEFSSFVTGPLMQLKLVFPTT